MTELKAKLDKKKVGGVFSRFWSGQETEVWCGVCTLVREATTQNDHSIFSTNPPNGADPNTSFNRTRCITAASRMMNHSEFDWSNPVWRQMIRGTMGAQATNTLAGVMSAGDKLVHIERWYGDPQGNRGGHRCRGKRRQRAAPFACEIDALHC